MNRESSKLEKGDSKGKGASSSNDDDRVYMVCLGNEGGEYQNLIGKARRLRDLCVDGAIERVVCCFWGRLWVLIGLRWGGSLVIGTRVLVEPEIRVRRHMGQV